MKIETHNINNTIIAEIISADHIITSVENALDILGNVYYTGCDKIILYEKNLTPDFFDLKNGIAGEILQKFSNYHVRLAIIGDFSKYTDKSNSIKDFIYESNKGKQINFVFSQSDAIQVLSN